MKYDKLTVMADFCSSGIWCRNDSCNVDFEKLNLPLELISEFEDWIEFYDIECFDHKDYSIKAEKLDELNKRGRELAKKLKLLHPEIQIFYRGEIKGGMLDHEEIKNI